MAVGNLKIAEDQDFQRLKDMVDNEGGWLLEYDKSGIRVWTKHSGDCTFKMVKVKCEFLGVNPMDLYDVIHDPDYRKLWDQSMLESIDIGHLNPNNDVCYYAVSCPPPMKNRDFVLQRSWLDMGNEQFIINHSVFHKDYPPIKNYIRGSSIFTGYLIRQLPKSGCSLGYVTQSDLHGDLPSWLVNRCTQLFAPKFVRQLEKAAIGYNAWKTAHNPQLKPWHFPEQISSPKIPINVTVTNVCVLPSPEVPVVSPPIMSSSKSSPPAISRKPSLTSIELDASTRKVRLLSCLNFTKHCLGKKQEPSSP